MSQTIITIASSIVLFFGLFQSCQTLSCQVVAAEDYLFQTYKSKSGCNEQSSFSVIKRIIEFEYIYNNSDTSVDVHVLLSTGFNEGFIGDSIKVVLTENRHEISIPLQNIITKEYTEHTSFTNSRPITRSETITVPGGTEIVTKPDGTVKNVIRKDTQHEIKVRSTHTESGTNARLQYFNKFSFKMDTKVLDSIIESGLLGYDLSLEYCILQANLNESQDVNFVRFLEFID